MTVRGGNGGSGCTSFAMSRRGKAPPDGGRGGDGGNIIIVVDTGLF